MEFDGTSFKDKIVFSHTYLTALWGSKTEQYDGVSCEYKVMKDTKSSEISERT